MVPRLALDPDELGVTSCLAHPEHAHRLPQPQSEPTPANVPHLTGRSAFGKTGGSVRICLSAEGRSVLSLRKNGPRPVCGTSTDTLDDRPSSIFEVLAMGYDISRVWQQSAARVSDVDVAFVICG